MTDARWDNDEQLAGAADATPLLGPLEQLRQLATAPNWVAEDPETHLGPGLHRALEAAGLTWLSETVGEDGVYEVVVRIGSAMNRRQVREAAWRVLGAAAEANSHVAEHAAESGTAFDLITGMAPGSTRFATHGHTLRLILSTGGTPDQLPRAPLD